MNTTVCTISLTLSMCHWMISMGMFTPLTSLHESLSNLKSSEQTQSCSIKNEMKKLKNKMVRNEKKDE